MQMYFKGLFLNKLCNSWETSFPRGYEIWECSLALVAVPASEQRQNMPGSQTLLSF